MNQQTNNKSEDESRKNDGTENKPSHSIKKKVVSWIGQILIFVAIFVSITWWQQKDMLQAASGELSPSLTLVDMKDTVQEFIPSQQVQKTLIYFFAPWCGVCHASIDNIEAIKQSSSGKINFYVVALDWKNKQEVEKFLSSHDLTIPVLLGTRDTQEEFRIGGFPSYYVIDKNGVIQSKDMGYTTELGMRFRLGLTDT